MLFEITKIRHCNLVMIPTQKPKEKTKMMKHRLKATPEEMQRKPLHYNLRKTNSSIAETSPIFFKLSLLGGSSTPIAMTACFRGAIRPTVMKLTFTFSSPKMLATAPTIPG
uniref:Uncharacterized protein n=1 Tax=Rhizophora mucronata TaxID=61149 RepID=A0A2P2NN65_RHIMU